MLRRKIYFTIFLISSFSFAHAIEIRVKIENGSRPGRAQTVDSIQVLKLEKGMQPVESRENTSATVFKDLPPGQPYMIQANYRGINYNQVVPPLQKKIFDVSIRVYELSSRFSDKISFRSLYRLKYINTYIEVLLFYHFNNTSKFTFAENNQGIRVYIPENATGIEASVSVGSGKSDIQWLKLQYQKIDGEKDEYILPYPVKPGERLYQVRYSLPYPDKEAVFQLKEYYPAGIPARIITEPGTIRLEALAGGKLEKGQPAPQPGQNMASFSGEKKKKYSFRLSGGEPVQELQTEVEVSSGPILARSEKAFITVILSIIFLSMIWFFHRNPGYLRKLEKKESSR